jgi:ABC-2 type transport system ATP-binding protein
VPAELAPHGLELSKEGCELTYTYDTQGERIGIVALLQDLSDAGILIKDLHTTESSLEDIFVSLVRDDK